MADPDYDGTETLELSKFKVQDLKLTEEESNIFNRRYSRFLSDSLKDEEAQIAEGC